MLQKQFFYINSRNRLTGTDSSFSYKLDIDRYIDYKHVSLISISIPKTFYAIQAGYNTFTVRHGIDEYLITIEPGNYTRGSFAKVLQLKLNEISSFVYVVSFPNINRTRDDGKYVFTVSNNTSQLLLSSVLFCSNSLGLIKMQRSHLKMTN